MAAATKKKATAAKASRIDVSPPVVAGYLPDPMADVVKLAGEASAAIRKQERDRRVGLVARVAAELANAGNISIITEADAITLTRRALCIVKHAEAVIALEGTAAEVAAKA